MTIEVPTPVTHILSLLQGNGHTAELVGGCVRDALLGRTPRDYDITTSARPEEVIAACGDIPVYPTGIQYGTVTVVHDDLPIEVTTYRADGAYSDGRRPDSVEFGCCLKEDVVRRDFTINALAWDGTRLIDLTHGQHDLTRRSIRAVGVGYARFAEDALRMLRAIRLSCQLGFDIDRDTWYCLCGSAPLINNVSTERIQTELMKILTSPEPHRGIELLRQARLLKIILPEIDRLWGFDQKNPRHDKCVFGHTMAVLAATPPDPAVRLAALFHDVGKPDTYSIDEKGIGHFYQHHQKGADITYEALKRLKFDNDTIEKVTLLVRSHMVRNPYFRQTGLKRMIRRVGAENMEPLFDLIVADVVGHAAPVYDDLAEVLRLREEVLAILAAGEPMTVRDLAISGKDLIEIGYQPGPIFSTVLNELLEKVLDDPEYNNREQLYEKAVYWYGEYKEEQRLEREGTGREDS